MIDDYHVYWWIQAGVPLPDEIYKEVRSGLYNLALENISFTMSRAFLLTSYQRAIENKTPYLSSGFHYQVRIIIKMIVLAFSREVFFIDAGSSFTILQLRASLSSDS
jgi:hypothetical protein